MGIIDEKKDFQKYFIDYLEKENGFIKRNSKYFDPLKAMDVEILIQFLNDTQPDEMEHLRKIWKESFEETLINSINREITKAGGSLLSVLKDGIELQNKKIRFMYNRPATEFNTQEIERYKKNIFSVMEEVKASDKERVDIVIFLNGLAIIAFELKVSAAGQNYLSAMKQYKIDRNPKTRLFYFKAGCLVCFAMDMEQCYMTTKLDKEKTVFLPFNKGKGEGIDTGAGNEIVEGKFASTYYVWEEILQKDSILELISKFIYIEKKEYVDELTGKKKTKEDLIFPRYHQLDVVKKLIYSVKEHKTTLNYLIQHSAGSGKTKSIAWLAHRLASVHDSENKSIFDHVIIVTDRVVVDRQLQDAIRAVDYQEGLIKVMDDKCSSDDLAMALKSRTKIIASTIQKFPYVVEKVKGLTNETFAVIIDEAHSSTSGKDILELYNTLSATADIEAPIETEDYIAKNMRSGKRENVSVFAFTATPKGKTLAAFGSTNSRGEKEAFHIYSMKQAIEEKFIVNVLDNYITYETYYKINKEAEDNPKYNKGKAKRLITNAAMLHPTNIQQRVAIIVEHFREYVKNELGGKAKAMIVTESRQAAVEYYKSFNRYVLEKAYHDIKALVAFSGKVTIGDEDFTEAGINKIPESRLTSEFDTDKFGVLIVADKYQTGFDQPKLSAMYITKKMKDVNAVQTLSRLNRICPPYEKKVFILDFVNSYEDIFKSFSKYYTTTILSDSVSIKQIYEISMEIDGSYTIDYDDINQIYDIYSLPKDKITIAQKGKLNNILNRIVKRIHEHNENKNNIVRLYRSFVKYYEFLQLIIIDFYDQELFKKYVAVRAVLPKLNNPDPEPEPDVIEILEKISFSDFNQKQKQVVKSPTIVSSPVIKLPDVKQIITDNKDGEEHLSIIIEELNKRTGLIFDSKSALLALQTIINIVSGADDMKQVATVNNLQDFSTFLSRKIEDELIEGVEQQNEFLKEVLKDKDIQEKIVNLIAPGMFNELKKNKK